MAIAMTLPVAAESINVSGGSGITGQGTYANGWCVSDGNGWYTFDAEGLRVYLVDYKTGKPIAGKKTIDITNYQFDYSQIWFAGKTKYDYLYGKQDLGLNQTYKPIHLSSSSSVGKLPNIIPWNEPDAATRIADIKRWLLDKNVVARLFQEMGTTKEET